VTTKAGHNVTTDGPLRARSTELAGRTLPTPVNYSLIKDLTTTSRNNFQQDLKIKRVNEFITIVIASFFSNST